MIAILDASVALALVVNEPGSEAATAAVAGFDLLVPEAFWVEVPNALVRKVRLGLLDRAAAASAYALLRRCVGRSVATQPLGPFALELSLDLEHTVYDCVYLAAAIAHRGTLLTADRALYAKSVAGGYGSVVRLVV